MVKLKEVDRNSRSTHFYLKDDDECFFFDNYSNQAEMANSNFNQLITNFMNETLPNDSYEWGYKLGAIETIATWLASAFNKISRIKETTIIPIPVAKIKENSLYDDRLLQVLTRTEDKLCLNLDIRELVINIKSSDSIHKKSEKLTPEELKMEYYRFDESCFIPLPKDLIFFDDVITYDIRFRAVKNMIRDRNQEIKEVILFGDILTNGADFRAVKDMVLDRIPKIDVIGIFVGKQIPSP